MKIAVCIKQVPVVSRISFDYENKTIVREGVPLEVNPFDVLAIGRAVELKKETDSEVVVLTMGPPQARDALAYAIALGADRAIHLTDRAMAGSDTLATARSLAIALERESFDLILCGRNSSDSETGQVGPEVAELLSIPHVSRVSHLEYDNHTRSIKTRRETEEGYEIVRCPLPTLVTVTEGIGEERYPSRQELEAAKEGPIEEITAAQLSDDLSLLGAKGSPTWVADIRMIEPQRLGLVIEEPDPKVAAQKLAEAFQQRPRDLETHKEPQWNRYQGREGKAIWVVAESYPSGPRRVTLELLGKARELAEYTKGEVAVVLIGEQDEQIVKTMTAYGADRVYLLDNITLGHPIGPTFTAFLAKTIAERNPYAVLFPSDTNGRDVASRVAARLGLGLTGDCVDLEVNEDGELVQLKPALGGNVVAPILSRTRPYMSTLLPGILNPITPRWEAMAEIEIINSPTADEQVLEVLEVHKQEDARGIELESARIVLGVGMGIGGPENLPTIYKLARSIGATLSATRSVTDAGWLPKQVQLGLTGKAIAPEVYIALGVRGAFNHMVGIQRAGAIIAVNNNQRAPMFKGADFGIVGDWKEYLPPLIEALRPLLKNSE